MLSTTFLIGALVGAVLATVGYKFAKLVITKLYKSLDKSSDKF